MTQDSTISELAALMKQVGDAHHDAFSDVDGHDPDWPLWYAERLLQPLNEQLNASLSLSDLVYLLIKLDLDRRRDAPGAEWTNFNARALAGLYL